MRVSYLFDPLCGWCYGAGPTLERLGQLDDVTLELMPTGLFAGEGARVMDAQFAAYAWQNDERIARLTGQPFSEIYRSRVLGHTGGMFELGAGDAWSDRGAGHRTRQRARGAQGIAPRPLC